MTMIQIGQTEDKHLVQLSLRRANRHGLITGATGTGKTVTLQTMMEQFSDNGVPIFAADIKGDLSGIAAAEKPTSQPCPTRLWDLFGDHGHQIHTSVQEMGADLLGAMLGLNATQQGALTIAFKVAEDEREYMLTLDDLRYTLMDMLDDRETICRTYGNITASSISAIQRNLMALEAHGGVHLFGEPGFKILEFMQTDQHGRGIVNLLHADELTRAPKLYAIFLLWLLSQLFKALPEAGDPPKPKLVFFFDEAHLLFKDAPKPLVEKIEQLVRLVRSKGVGVFFVTQSQRDVPESVLEQLGSKIMHGLRAFNQKQMREVKGIARTLRENPDVDAYNEIVTMGTGYALVSCLGDDSTPDVVQKVRIRFPDTQVGPISNLEREQIIGIKPAKAGEEAQSLAFRNRMRRERDLPEISPDKHAQETWQDFIPKSSYKPEQSRSFAGRVISLVWWTCVASVSAYASLTMISG